MRINRKTNSCLNCGFTLDKVYNYCPNCGQGNHDDNVSFGTLVGDFFSTYFAIDSKFGKTVKPFFLKPGYLTNQYISGKRATYAHPIRLYLIISIFYFFMVTLAATDLANENNDDTVIKTSDQFDLLKGIDNLDDSTGREIAKALTGRERSLLKEELDENDLQELRIFLSTIDTASQVRIRTAVGDSIADSLYIFKPDSLYLLKVKKDTTLNKSKVKDDEDDFIISRIDTDKVKQLDKDHELSDQQIYDSLNLGELDYFDKRMAIQTIRVTRADKEQIISYIVKNFPLMMLVLIPIFALILKLLYLRRNQLYIKHLVHALHLHTYAYFVYGVFILLTVFIITHEDAGEILNMIAFLIVTIYAFISFLKVYKQRWFKTFIKFNIVGAIYCFSIFLFFLLEMAVSLLLF
ncbi:MAG: DUF3667 domain-containing protein [Fulvivirga sp.]